MKKETSCLGSDPGWDHIAAPKAAETLPGSEGSQKGCRHTGKAAVSPLPWVGVQPALAFCPRLANKTNARQFLSFPGSQPPSTSTGRSPQFQAYKLGNPLRTTRCIGTLFREECSLHSALSVPPCSLSCDSLLFKAVVPTPRR